MQLCCRKIYETVKNNDTEAFAAAFSEFAEKIQETVLRIPRSLIEANDEAILAQRGVRQLTTGNRIPEIRLLRL